MKITKKCKRFSLFLAAVLLLTTVFASLPTLAATGAVEIAAKGGVATNVVWNYGYVGSSTNASGNVNKISNNSNGKNGTYRYSDILTIPHAGTTLSFSDPAGVAVSENAYVISSWKQENGNWVIDLNGTNIAGVGAKTRGIAVYDSNTEIVTYTYTTKKDNEHLRLGCYGTKGSETCPTVYVGDSAANADGVLENLIWFPGYIASSVHGTVANRDKIVAGGAGYAYSAPILLKKAGTKISFKVTLGGAITKFASQNAYVFSAWERNADNSFSFGYGCPGNDQGQNTAWQTVNGNTCEYFYTSSTDNEYVRISYCSGTGSSGTSPTVTVTENGGGDSTLALAYYDPANILFQRTVKWNDGYVGSSTNPDFANKITTKAGNYKYSDIITVWGKGSLLMFTDAGGFASNAAYVFSSFASDDNSLTEVDTSGTNIPGEQSGVYVKNPDGSRTYYYYTTKDVEYIRITMRSDAANRGTVHTDVTTSFIAPAVYVLSSSTLNTAPAAATGRFLPQLTSTLGSYSSLFAGKEITLIGDSYFAGNGIDKNLVWVKQFADLYGMTFYNQGINGSSVSDYDPSKNPMVNRWNKMKGSENTALVLFEGGRNDYNAQTPIGELGDTGTKTFYGALDVVMKGLLQKFPNALIVCLNPWDLTRYPAYNNHFKNGYTSNEYAAAFCNYVNSLDNDRVVMLNTNSTDVVPVYLQDAAFRLAYAQTAADASHLNVKGMSFILPFFEKRLAEFMTEYTAMQNAGGGIVFSENGKPVKVKSTAAAGEITVPSTYLQTSDDLIGWSGTISGKEVLLPVGGTLTVAAGESGTLTPKYLHMSPAGNTIRLVSGSEGIRFLTEVDLAEYEALANIPGVTLARGTLIVPQFYLEALGNELTFDSLAKMQKKYLHIKAGGWYQQGTDSALFAGSVGNIYEHHYTMEYVATGYVTVTYTDGTTETFYADKSPEKGVTVYQLATNALADTSSVRTDYYQYEAEGGYSPYTQSQRTFLNRYLGNVLRVTESTSAACGFVATAANAGSAEYVITIDSDKDLMIIRRADGTAITDKTFSAVFFCGAPTSFTVKNGALQFFYSEYTQRY